MFESVAVGGNRLCIRSPLHLSAAPHLKVFLGLSTGLASLIVGLVALPLAQIQVWAQRGWVECQGGGTGAPGLLARPQRTSLCRSSCTRQSVHDMAGLGMAATACMVGAVFATLIRLLAIPGNRLAETALLPPPTTRAIEGLVAALQMSFAFGGQVRLGGRARVGGGQRSAGTCGRRGGRAGPG